jgi:hypothetical protein
MLESWKTKSSKKTPLLQSSRESKVQKKKGCIATWGKIVQGKCTCTKQDYFEASGEVCCGRSQKQVIKLLLDEEIKQEEVEGGKQKMKGEYTN